MNIENINLSVTDNSNILNKNELDHLLLKKKIDENKLNEIAQFALNELKNIKKDKTTPKERLFSYIQLSEKLTKISNHIYFSKTLWQRFIFFFGIFRTKGEKQLTSALKNVNQYLKVNRKNYLRLWNYHPKIKELFQRKDPFKIFEDLSLEKLKNKLIVNWNIMFSASTQRFMKEVSNLQQVEPEYLIHLFKQDLELYLINYWSKMTELQRQAIELVLSKIHMLENSLSKIALIRELNQKLEKDKEERILDFLYELKLHINSLNKDEYLLIPIAAETPATIDLCLIERKDDKLWITNLGKNETTIQNFESISKNLQPLFENESTLLYKQLQRFLKKYLSGFFFKNIKIYLINQSIKRIQHQSSADSLKTITRVYEESQPIISLEKELHIINEGLKKLGEKQRFFLEAIKKRDLRNPQMLEEKIEILRLQNKNLEQYQKLKSLHENNLLKQHMEDLEKKCTPGLLSVFTGPSKEDTDNLAKIKELLVKPEQIESAIGQITIAITKTETEIEKIKSDISFIEYWNDLVKNLDHLKMKARIH